jgi:hypothetical protein
MLAQLTPIFLAAIFSLSGCKEKEKRTPSSGEGDKPVKRESQAQDAVAGDEGSPSSSGSGSPSSDSSGGATGLTGKTLEQCQAQGKAWIAVVDNGNSPATCGASLATWCCTEDEIGKRYPSLAEKLSGDFAPIVAGGHKLYACSKESDSKTTFHFAKFENGRISYQYRYIEKIFEVDSESPDSACQKVSTADLGGPASTGSDPSELDADGDETSGDESLSDDIQLEESDGEASEDNPDDTLGDEEETITIE